MREGVHHAGGLFLGLVLLTGESVVLSRARWPDNIRKSPANIIHWIEAVARHGNQAATPFE
jgi:hypothetical protein